MIKYPWIYIGKKKNTPKVSYLPSEMEGKLCPFGFIFNYHIANAPNILKACLRKLQLPLMIPQIIINANAPTVHHSVHK